MKSRTILALLITLFLMGSVMAQTDTPETPEPTAEATAEATPAIPEVTTDEAYQEAIRIATAVGNESGFLKGAGLGSLFTGAVILSLFYYVLRSPVAQTYLEGMLVKRLTKEQREALYRIGGFTQEIGSVLQKVSDGIPNDVTVTTKVDVASTPSSSNPSSGS